MNNVFAERARALRESKNLTTRMMGEILGKSEAQVSYYENAKNEPTLSVLRKYAEYFNVTLDYLVGLEDNPERR